MNRVVEFLKYLRSVDGAAIAVARRIHKILVNVMISLFALLILGYILNILGLKGVNIVFGLILVIGALYTITKPDTLLRLIEFGTAGGILSPNQTMEQSVKTLVTGYFQTIKMILFFWSFSFFALGTISFESAKGQFWVMILGVVIMVLWPRTTSGSKTLYSMRWIRLIVVSILVVFMANVVTNDDNLGSIEENSQESKLSEVVKGYFSKISKIFEGKPELVWLSVGEMTYDAKNVGWSKVTITIPQSHNAVCRIKAVQGYHQYFKIIDNHYYIPPEGRARAGCILEDTRFTPLAQLIKVNGVTNAIQSNEFDCSSGNVIAEFTPNMQTTDSSNFYKNHGKPVFVVEKLQEVKK